MAAAGLKAVFQWVMRTMMKSKGETGIVKTLPNKDLVELNTQVTAQRLMQNGIDPTQLKNADQVENAIIAIESKPKTGGVTSAKSAKVFDMEGKEIDPKKGIMGGKQVDDDLPPPGSRGGPDDIAAPVQSADESLRDMTEAEIKKKLEKGNKEGIARIRTRQKMVDDAIDNVSPGFSGDRKVDAELVAEDLAERMGKVYDDLPTKERLKLYEEAYQGLTKKKFDPDGMAQGGRAGFDNGGAPSIKYDFDRKQEPMGPEFETNKVEDAIREIIRRRIPTDFARIPVTDRAGILLGLDEAGIAGLKDLLGGELKFGAGKNFGTGEKQFDLMFRKKFKDGSNMTRRTFLKILGGAMSIPIIGKFLKPLKTAKGVTKVPMIKTDDVAGKPEWFDQLVNKVIVEGDDVTKKFATGERQSIHQKTLDDGSVVRVTEDVDQGAVRVEYQSEKNVFGDDVQLQYKKPLPDESDPRPTAEFTTAESGPVGRSYGPDDYEIDVDEVGGTSIRDLDSDVSKLKEYATGQKPTMTEILQNKKRRDKAKAISEDPEAQSDAVIRRQGEADDSYYGDPEELASGGIARMLGE